MKEDVKFKPLEANYTFTSNDNVKIKGILFQEDVRSAVMGMFEEMASVNLTYSACLESYCKSRKPHYSATDVYCGACRNRIKLKRKWFPVFFEEVEGRDLCPHELSDCDECEGGAE